MTLRARRAEGGLDLMRTVLGEHLKETGRALISDPERTKDPVDFVHRLLHEKDKYDRCAGVHPPAGAHRVIVPAAPGRSKPWLRHTTSRPAAVDSNHPVTVGAWPARGARCASLGGAALIGT